MNIAKKFLSLIEEETFDIGDKVKIVGSVEGSGKTGEVIDISPSGKYAIVKVDGKKVSYSNSDLKKVG